MCSSHQSSESMGSTSNRHVFKISQSNRDPSSDSFSQLSGKIEYFLKIFHESHGCTIQLTRGTHICVSISCDATTEMPSTWSITKKLAKVVVKEVIKEIDTKPRKEATKQYAGGTSRNTTSCVSQNHDELILPNPWPIPIKGVGPWNVVRQRKHILAVVASDTEDVLRSKIGQPSLVIQYASGRAGSSSGFCFHAAPKHCCPAKVIQFSYNVYFPDSFKWVRGGKLPGIYIGSPGATGGNWELNSGSVRVVWQRKGVACLYVYIPTQICPDQTKEGAIEMQHETFKRHSHTTAKGCHLWHKGPLCFNKGQWNSVKLRVEMNDIGASNGRVSLEVNGQREHIGDMIWRSDPHLLIGGLSIQTFFGGHTKECAAPDDVFTKFQDFTIS